MASGAYHLVLRDLHPGAASTGYRAVRPGFAYLFNSYYEAVGAAPSAAARGLLTRPSVADDRAPIAPMSTPRCCELVARGRAPCGADRAADRARPASRAAASGADPDGHQACAFARIRSLPGLSAPAPARGRSAMRRAAGCDRVRRRACARSAMTATGFAFDNEAPRHKVWLEPFRLASRPVTNGEYLAFIADGGYRRAEFWLSDGWATVQERRLGGAALLARRRTANGRIFTLAGARPLDADAPVVPCQLLRGRRLRAWAGKRLPTEAEWEIAAAEAVYRSSGNLTDQRGIIIRRPASAERSQLRADDRRRLGMDRQPLYALSRLRPLAGAIGEYNGKFMVEPDGVARRRGGDAAGTCRGSPIAISFPPASRWAFCGMRLAEDHMRTAIGALRPFTIWRRRAESFRDCVLARTDAQRPRRCRANSSTTSAARGCSRRSARLPEYYPTRTEIALLDDYAGEIAALMGPQCRARRVRQRLQRARCASCCAALDRPRPMSPIDISRERAARSRAHDSRRDFPQLRCASRLADYTRPLDLPPLPERTSGRRLGFFPGSTIGNFEPAEAPSVPARAAPRCSARAARC